MSTSNSLSPMCIKGSLTRDFRLQVFFINQCPSLGCVLFRPKTISGKKILTSISWLSHFIKCMYCISSLLNKDGVSVLSFITIKAMHLLIPKPLCILVYPQIKLYLSFTDFLMFPRLFLFIGEINLCWDLSFLFLYKNLQKIFINSRFTMSSSRQDSSGWRGTKTTWQLIFFYF